MLAIVSLSSNVLWYFCFENARGLELLTKPFLVLNSFTPRERLATFACPKSNRGTPLTNRNTLLNRMGSSWGAIAPLALRDSAIAKPRAVTPKTAPKSSFLGVITCVSSCHIRTTGKCTPLLLMQGGCSYGVTHPRVRGVSPVLRKIW